GRVDLLMSDALHESEKRLQLRTIRINATAKLAHDLPITTSCMVVDDDECSGTSLDLHDARVIVTTHHRCWQAWRGWRGIRSETDVRCTGWQDPTGTAIQGLIEDREASRRILVGVPVRGVIQRIALLRSVVRCPS